jgi:hypothetical protein
MVSDMQSLASAAAALAALIVLHCAHAAFPSGRTVNLGVIIVGVCGAVKLGAENCSDFAGPLSDALAAAGPSVVSGDKVAKLCFTAVWSACHIDPLVLPDFHGASAFFQLFCDLFNIHIFDSFVVKFIFSTFSASSYLRSAQVFYSPFLRFIFSG